MTTPIDQRLNLKTGQKKLNTITWVLLGSRASEKADKQETFLSINIRELDNERYQYAKKLEMRA